MPRSGFPPEEGVGLASPTPVIPASKHSVVNKNFFMKRTYPLPYPRVAGILPSPHRDNFSLRERVFMHRTPKLLAPALVCLLLSPGWCQPTGPRQAGAEIEYILGQYRALGSRPFSTRWPSGTPKETLERAKDGTINYTRFFPTGGYAARYQRKPNRVIKLERFYGNGKTELMIFQDERIVDYTSYWENGNKKAKYQCNRQTHRVDYDARDQQGKQVYP